ncbi:MAG: hypothetical protein AAB469_00530 [Patescibacteria group bacterium]
MPDIRKNLIIICFLLVGLVLILVYLNFNTPRKTQSAQILDSTPELKALPEKETVKDEFLKNFEEAVFSPDRRKIAYLNQGAIYISNPDGSESKEILKTRIKNLELLWPKPEFLVLKSGENGGQTIFLINLEDGSLKKLDEQTGFPVENRE